MPIQIENFRDSKKGYSDYCSLENHEKNGLINMVEILLANNKTV